MAKPIYIEQIDLLRGRVSPGDLSFTFARSGGPGGQNVNKLNTRVTLWFDLEQCETLTEAEKRRIHAKLAGRISRDGRLRVTASSARTQAANRTAATERFYELLAAALHREKPRRPTRVPASAKRKRLEGKRRQGAMKQQRRSDAAEE